MFMVFSLERSNILSLWALGIQKDHQYYFGFNDTNSDNKNKK